ncbi:hypothetical protein RJZ56_001415 [Blastomyces dermatitidis]
MLPCQSTTANTKLILDFGTFLHKIFLKHVEDDDETVFHNKLPSINRHISRILEVPSVPLLEDRALLDSIGTKLWNVCTRLIRKDGGKGERLLVLCAGSCKTTSGLLSYLIWVPQVCDFVSVA